MRIFWLVMGAALGFVFVAALGYLSVQVEGAWNGAVFDLMNNVIWVVSSHVPYLLYVSMAGLCGLILYLTSQVSPISRESSRFYLGTGFVVRALALLVTALLLLAEQGTPPMGIAAGWMGWLMQAGKNPALLVVVVAITIELVRLGARLFSRRSPSRVRGVSGVDSVHNLL